MIQRRSFLIGFCGLGVAPAFARASFDAPAVPAEAVVADAIVPSSAGSVVFTIHGWNEGERKDAAPADQHVVLHLPGSWRASWM
jgi:hypothetical protein